MGTLKADAITSATSGSDLNLSGSAGGVVDIEANLKIGGTTGLPISELRTSSGTASNETFLRGDGTWNAAGGGAWNLIGTATGNNQSSIVITGIDDTYDTYAIGLSNLVPYEDNKDCELRFGDSSGIDSGSNDYQILMIRYDQGANHNRHGISADRIEWANNVGKNYGEACGGLFFLHRPGSPEGAMDSGTMRPMITGSFCYIKSTGEFEGGVMVAERQAEIVMDRVELYFKESTIRSGRFSIWGIAHA